MRWRVIPVRSDRPRVYRRRRPWRALVITLICLVLAAVIAYVTLFFGLKKHIVYTDDGLYLDVPWIAEEMEELRKAKSAA